MQSIQNLGLALIAMAAGAILDSRGYLVLEVFFCACICSQYFHFSFSSSSDYSVLSNLHDTFPSPSVSQLHSSPWWCCTLWITSKVRILSSETLLLFKKHISLCDSLAPSTLCSQTNAFHNPFVCPFCSRRGFESVGCSQSQSPERSHVGCRVSTGQSLF